MTSYQIDLAIDPATLTVLKNGGYRLYAFKAVHGEAAAGGAPLVWFVTASFLMQTQIAWQPSGEVFISLDDIVPYHQVTPKQSCAVSPGQAVTIGDDGQLSPPAPGAPGVVTVINPGAVPWVCGLSQSAADGFAPICALGPFDQGSVAMASAERVLLVFSNQAVLPGAAVMRSFSQGVVLDLVACQRRAVSFDIDRGWSWDAQDWAQAVAPNADIAALLILP